MVDKEPEIRRIIKSTREEFINEIGNWLPHIKYSDGGFGGITPPMKLSSLLLHLESQKKIFFQWIINGKNKTFKAIDTQGRTLLERGLDYSDKGTIDKNILEELLGKKIPERKEK